MENLVSLTKFGKEDNVNPSKEHILCIQHYEEMKKKYLGYNINKRESSIPQIWCEICTPGAY